MILLDTHVILWWQAGGARLSRRAMQEIARADTVLVSPVSCWEVATLVATGRIALDRDVFTWVRDLLAQEQVEVAPLSPRAAIAAATVGNGFTGDPADRFLYATARELIVPLVTKDTAIRAYAARARDLRVVW